MLIAELMRRERIRPHDPRRSYLWHAMTPIERAAVAVLSLPFRLFDWVRGKIRS